MRKSSFIAKFANLGVFIVIAYASYLLILLSLPYIHFEKNVEFLATKQLIYHVDVWLWSFYIHVFTSPIIIVAGLLQFSRWIIRKYPRTHKHLGYWYIIVVLFISGPSAFVMSLYANGGYAAQVSFVALSIIWMLVTYIAYRKIKKRDFESHIKWNLRSYALTLSAITLRFYAYLFDVFNVDIGPRETYIILAYLGWIPNLLIVEILIRLKYPQYLLSYKN
ncbi:MAG: DUF2306 domain-containing protein [Crocinitomicaceae bacterium]|nr:DUF2306 domain-containing protein [Crocinitomicaceae bacterium]